MFKLEHHQKIQHILLCLSPPFFYAVHAYFGGGTLLALRYNEYRWSKDIDFICPVGDSYRQLRTAIMSLGYDALFQSQEGIQLPREIKADQYGVRFPVVVQGTVIKFEIIAEARIELDAPTYLEWMAIPCLNFEDSCAEKLLANADRWSDSSVESRDLIDLAILRLQSSFSAASFAKAEAAYPVLLPLKKAIENFQQKAEYRKKCFRSLQLSNWPILIDGMDLLAQDLSLPFTPRNDDERHIGEYGLPLIT